MEKDERDWIVYVAWDTITKWKEEERKKAAAMEDEAAESDPGKSKYIEYPFQYASTQPGFMYMRNGDNLWLVSFPQFSKGYCQAPSIMARLNLEGVYDKTRGWPVRVSRHVEGRGDYLAVGKWGRLIETYPPLYNIFDFLMNAEFEGDVKNLGKYRDWLDEGKISSRGPYGRLVQHFRRLRLFTRKSGEQLREKHRTAVEGRRIFISYYNKDIKQRGVETRGDEVSWAMDLVDYLEKANILCWWDKQQILGPRAAWKKQEKLISALLDDGVRQATWFVALGTKGYGTPGDSNRNWTLEEWKDAGKEADKPRPRGNLRRLLIDFGESNHLSILRRRDDEPIAYVARDAKAEDVGEAIVKKIEEQG